jgi:Acyl-CoA reductase (LuxC)
MSEKIFKSGYLPPNWLKSQEFGDIQCEQIKFSRGNEIVIIEVPHLTLDQSNSLCQYLKIHGRRSMKKISVEQIQKAISNVILKLLNKDDPTRQLLDHIIPVITGFDSKMIELNISSYLRVFRLHSLKSFLAEDLKNIEMLNDFSPALKGGWHRYKSADLLLHIWSANVPALSLWSLICSLLVKSVSIGKLASDEPIFASYFVNLLVKEIPILQDCLSIIWWKGGDFSRCQPILNQSEIVVAYGSNETLDNIRSRTLIGTRFLGHGHKISFSVISQTALDNNSIHFVVEQAALDIVRFDQMGCYSPHAYFVQKGGLISPKDFALSLYSALENLSHRFSSRQLSSEEANSIVRWHQDNIFNSINNSNLQILGNPNSATQVIYSDSPIALKPTVLNRNVYVIAIDKWEDLETCLLTQRELLQTVGVALSVEELNFVSNLLIDLGVTRICSIGQMTNPSTGWHHDGGYSLLDYVKVVDVELSAISLAERFTSYRD